VNTNVEAATTIPKATAAPRQGDVMLFLLDNFSIDVLDAL